ncbi:MAG: hypothetical protein FJ095_01875 [Deltaproteobacteria bacterium]|nr:hypothetical protein [Deltaproteobacteria bacterium]
MPFRHLLPSALLTFAACLFACDQSGVIRTTTTSFGEATVSADSVDFGALDCGGGAPESKTFTIQNDGEGTLRWKATLDSNAYFDIVGTRGGALASGESATITVTAQKMPVSSMAGDIVSASVLVTTDDVARPQFYIPLKATAQGATLELVAPSVADFGQVPLATASNPIPVVLRNTGNVPAKVAVTSAGDGQFSFEWAGGPASVEVAPGATLAGLTAAFTPTSTNTTSSAGLIEVEGPVCGKSATSLSVKGQGQGGLVGISPGTLDLGKVACKTQADPQILTIYNAGNLVFTWAASLKDGSNFKLSQTGGAVVAGGAVQLTVTPNALGMTTNLADDAFGDTLIVTTNIPGDAPHEIPIKQTATGAILKWNATPLDFGTQPAFVASPGKFVVVTNDGNASANVKVSGSGQFTSSEGVVPGGGGSLVSVVKYTPDNLGPQSGTIVLSTDSPICQPLPASVAATGAGKASASALSVGGPPRNRGSEQGGCVILSNAGDRIACFGNNSFGQLGTKQNLTGPFIVPTLKDIVSISSAGDFNCAADKNGVAWCWGNNRNRNNTKVGKLGAQVNEWTEVPQQVQGVSNVKQVAAGHNVACALTNAGEVFCWGSNRRGKVGTGSEGSHDTAATQVANVANATQIAVQAGGGCARLDNGTVKCWGRNARGNLGSCCGPQTLQVQNMNDAVSVAAMTGAARQGPRCALRMNGQVACWGDPARGQLGGGFDFRGEVQNPSTVSLSGPATMVAAYQNGGCALLGTQSIQCWGRNEQGQVGDGGLGQRNSPQTVLNINDATAIAAGGWGACAIVTGGSVKCWGNYGAGSSSTPQTLRYF